MTRTETMQTNELTVVQVSARGAEIGVNGTNRWITWAQLREAASQPIYGPAGCQGGQPDAELRQVYAGLLRRARVMLRQLPRRDQGIEVRVFTRTGGATWVAEVYDGSGEHRRDLMHADEGLDEPRGHLAVSTGRKIARRLGASLRIC